MSIVLLILKIIGIMLLVVLGLFLLIVILVSTVPVRYRIVGKAEDTVSVIIRVRWLLGAISFLGQFENRDFTRKIKIFGIPFERRRKNRQSTVDLQVTKEEVIEKTERETDGEAEEQNKESENINFKKTQSFFHKIKGLPSMIKIKLENLKEKLLNFRDIAGRIKQEIKDETNQLAVKVLFQEMKYLLKHISPRKVKAEMSFGMEDPATTGQILGIISTLPLVYRYQLQLYPDFEAETFYLKGSFDIKGYARGVHAFRVLWHFIKDKNLRSMIEKHRSS